MEQPRTDPKREGKLRDAIVAAALRLHCRGLIAGAEGNVSVRLGDEWLLITPAGRDKAALHIGDIVRVPLAGPDCHERMAGDPAGDGHPRDNFARPSSELEMHCTIYAARPDVCAIVHAHPPVATGFAAAGRCIPSDILPELPAVVGPVALVSYARPGTPALSQALRPWLASHEVFLLANHGVTVVGSSLEAALLRMESVEQGARSILVAELLGGARHLPRGEADALAAGRLATQVTTLPSGDSVPSALMDQDRNR